MFTIGDFARHGRVSVRMLRHYDRLGLLRPAAVDPATGYRSYEAAQLSRLNRIVALKDLGFTLERVRSILDEEVDAGELRGMLRLRRAELEEQVRLDTARLTQVEARLSVIEREGAMPTQDVQVKPVPQVRLAQLSGEAESFEPDAVGPVIGPLYQQLHERMEKAGVTSTGPGVAWYEQRPGGEGVIVHAGCPVDLEPDPAYDFEVVDLPGLEQAATILHHGPMDDVLASIQRLAHWIEASGYRSTGLNRELYLEYGTGDPATWVTELQEPVVKA
ncbi:MerR family transcriptional regulator [Kineosporia rhizophila]|uniref:MerR family transcriptional regulator n=1 Tax=Kineosporia TaxID=49184 RepID=UPI000B0E9632|nr:MULTISPECIES: MerR family transcriptional regulator [Kineosporia]MCE0534472.1 MerR family transcriptional regulator [Kineosporia rhizophila]GLY14007.1 MerR family transcriptional regulator [Kineosporia sp. NBRC 101677]